ARSGGRLHVQNPRLINLPARPSVASISRDCHTAVVASESEGQAMILDLESERLRCQPLAHPLLGEASLSPDGRWAATWGWHTGSVKIWDARTGELASDLAIGDKNSAFFSPDGRTLVTSLGSEYQFRQVPTWSPVRTLPWEVWSYPGWVAFS